VIKIRRKNGIELINLKSNKTFIRFDPKRAVRSSLNFISHAHADHTPTSSEYKASTIADPITIDVMTARTGNSLPLSLIDLPENIELYDSGHCIGGKMIKIELSGKTFLYTGDFNPYERLDLFQQAKPQKVDILIIEGTYGDKQYKFPPPSQVFSDAFEWLNDHIEKGNSVLLQGYSFGKAQLISRFLELTGFDYFVELPVYKVHKVLEKYQYTFKGKLARGSDVYKKGTIIVGPYSTRSSLRFDTIASFTGWAADKRTKKYQTRADKNFILSDHSDYDGLLNFIQQSDPEKVFVFDGQSRKLAVDIRKKLKIKAYSLDDSLQILDLV
jgi:Cft2 family RNA processing exonuclease